MSFSSDTSTQRKPVHEQVVYAVANANGVDPTDLAPLYETVDPEALDALFADGSAGAIKFTYEGHDVVVRGDGPATVDGTAVDRHTFQTIGVGDDPETSAAGQ